jgi:hypothetical protein
MLEMASSSRRRPVERCSGNERAVHFPASALCSSDGPFSFDRDRFGQCRITAPQRFGELFRRAIDVGRDHVSATVNTLVLAYVGTSLTTLLVFGSGQVGFIDAVNLEVIASVIAATLVGSIGLICAVPITTALAAPLAESIPAEELAADRMLGTLTSEWLRRQ